MVFVQPESVAFSFFSFSIKLGPALPKELGYHSTLEIQGNVFVFGGWNNDGEQSSIYRLTCSAGLCAWSTLNQELKVARHRHIIIPVPDNFCK